MFRNLLTICLTITSIILVQTTVLAGDFRMENHVFSGDKLEPVSHSFTIFQQGFVYDFLQSPAETTVYDKVGGKFFILDDARRIRTEITNATIDSFAKQLQERAAKHEDPLLNFFANPLFEESFDSNRNELKLRSPLVNYRVMLSVADSPAIANQYREFCDKSAVLNTMLAPGSRPPFSRMKLNEAICKHEAIPLQVVLTINSSKDKGQTPSVMRSEHTFGSTITSADMERIKLAQQAMTNYKAVSFDKYNQTKR